MNKNISLLISSLAGGGSEAVCVSIANCLVNKGWKVDLVILNLNNELYLDNLSNKVSLIVLNKKNSRYSIFSLLKYIYKERPTKFLIFNYELTVIINILRLLFKIKIKIISRNSNTLTLKIRQFQDKGFWSKNIVLPLIKHFYHRTDHIVNQCYAMREDLINMYPKLKKNSSVIYNPIPIHVQKYVNKYDLSKIKKNDYILCVGRLEKQKAFNYAIEAFAGIKDKYPKLRLKIVGYGSMLRELKQKTIDFNIERRVDFEGFQKDIVPYYLHAKGTILSSLYEGYPNVLIESIAMNTPVVAFDCPSGPREIIQNGLNGYLVKYKDVNDLKNNILKLMDNKFNYENLKDSLKKNQIKYVIKNYEDLINKYN